MSNQNSWVILIGSLVAFYLVGTMFPRLPWSIQLAIAFLAAGWMFIQGINQMRFSGGSAMMSNKRVQYWRGQRIEINESRATTIKRSFNRRTAIAMIYVVVGFIALIVCGVQLVKVL